MEVNRNAETKVGGKGGGEGREGRIANQGK